MLNDSVFKMFLFSLVHCWHQKAVGMAFSFPEEFRKMGRGPLSPKCPWIWRADLGLCLWNTFHSCRGYSHNRLCLIRLSVLRFSGLRRAASWCWGKLGVKELGGLNPRPGCAGSQLCGHPSSLSCQVMCACASFVIEMEINRFVMWRQWTVGNRNLHGKVLTDNNDNNNQ